MSVLLTLWTSGHLAFWPLDFWNYGLLVFRTSGFPDFWPSGLSDFLSSGLLVFQTSVLLVFGLLTIWTSSLLAFLTSGLPDFWPSGLLAFGVSGLLAFFPNVPKSSWLRPTVYATPISLLLCDTLVASVLHQSQIPNVLPDFPYAAGCSISRNYAKYT